MLGKTAGMGGYLESAVEIWCSENFLESMKVILMNTYAGEDSDSAGPLL